MELEVAVGPTASALTSPLPSVMDPEQVALAADLLRAETHRLRRDVATPGTSGDPRSTDASPGTLRTWVESVTGVRDHRS